MSDKSFSDYTNRNIVKNPLLSTAVTSLSLEDLTHNAVLLPVALNQELINTQDTQTSQSVTLTQPDPGTGDFRPPTFSAHDTPQNAKPNELKAKEDDFDVNEYFARLQGTRYVSAPLNSSLKDPTPAEENLEEINLNEPEALPAEVQQSLTADIAQNFSQLPTVLPQVASAVFSSFSNMLNYKSREVTPDDRPQRLVAQEMQRPQGQEFQRPQEAFQRQEEVGVPLMGVDEPAVAREVAPPPKEIPVGGTTNFRITTKKKAYAQIPGLSSQLPPQNIGEVAQSYTQPSTNTQFFTPDNAGNVQPPIGAYRHENVEIKPQVQPPPTDFNIFNPIETQKDNTQPPANIEPIFYAVKPTEGLRQPEAIPQESAPTNPLQGSVPMQGAPIIPPPPMFSNMPRKDGLTAAGKSVLPPSVARRIGANHPFIKPTMQTPAYPASNIFIPAPISDNVLQSPNASDVRRPSIELSSSDPPPVPNLPSAFVQFKSTYSSLSSITLPGDLKTIEAHDKGYSHGRGKMPTPADAILVPPPASAGVRLPSPNEPARMPSPNQMPHAPPPCFNPGNLSSSLSAMNAPRCKSIESVVASNTAKITAAPPPTFFYPCNMPMPTIPPMIPCEPSNPQMFFTPESAQPPNIPSSTFYNPNTIKSSPLTIDSQDPTSEVQNIGQYFDQNAPSSEPNKPIPEPPKLTGGINYRMTKKRPQYYSGPIEGVGAISNNVKPIIPGADTTVFQGALFTPDQAPVEQQVMSEQAAPFDISKPAEMTSSYTPFAINTQINNQAQSYVDPDYNTAFDLSRSTTETYDPTGYDAPKDESKGFGIIGSLKSKLSSIDINKIQNSVTTFFDPDYNSTKKESSDNQGNPPYAGQGSTGFGSSNQQSNLEIYVPNVDRNAGYNQSFNSENQYQNIYSSIHAPSFDHQNQYYSMSGNSHTHSHVIAHGHHPPRVYHGIPPNPGNFGHHGVPNLGGSQPPQAHMPPEAPSARRAFEEANHQHLFHHLQHDPHQQQLSHHHLYHVRQTTDVNMNQEVFPQKTVKKITSLTGEPAFKDNNYNTYNLFGHTATITPADIENLEDNQEDASDLSYFDNQQFQPSVKPDNLNNKLENLQVSNNNPEQLEGFDLGKTVDEGLDFSIDLIQPTLNCDIKSSIDFFGSVPQTDFIQSSFGCAFIKKDDDEEISKEVEKVVDETISLVLNEDVKDDIPPVNMSAVPLFGLSNILAEKTKEITDLEECMQNVNIKGENDFKNRLDSDTSAKLIDTLNTSGQPLTDEENEGISDLNICETCREIEKPDDADFDDLTVKLIENITSPIQLSNPVAAALTETNTPVDNKTDFESKQCAEISHITEETIETIQVQSATELLEEENPNTNPEYGCVPENTSYPISETLTDHTYTFQVDPNTIGFFGNNPMFFDNIPNNASDEIKAEFKISQEDTPAVLPRQMSVPTAPPAEDEDSKSDETGGLDVLSIEQDAKKDFPIYEEFVIEPSETDDDKIEYREKEKSTDDSPEEDSFTNRVERFKKMGESHDDVFEAQKTSIELASATSPTVTMASYFDTGNYAAESHYRNSLTSPSSIPNLMSSPDGQISIPPGFEDEYKRRFSGVASEVVSKDSDIDINVLPSIPDTSTQTRAITTATYSNVSNLSTTVTSSIEAKYEKPPETKLPEFSSVFGKNHESGDSLSSSIFDAVEDKKEMKASLFSQLEINTEAEKPLPDPISFFSAEETTTTEASDGGFNRLASYFQTPAKNDHGKSFFELSQSQNHYRHALDIKNSDQFAQNSKDVKKFFDKNDNQNSSSIQNIPPDTYVANLQLMKDLTSVHNLGVQKDQIVRTVNYFTVEYDNEEIKPLKSDIKTENLKDAPKKQDDGDVNDDEEAMSLISKCVYCCNVDSRNVVTLNKVELDNVDFKFKKCMDSDSAVPNKERVGSMEEGRDDRRKEVAVNFGALDEESEGVAMVTENRTTGEYSPVRHHWFYRVDFEGKSIWRGFSATDNKALEEAFQSPELTENTLVPTDGGRFDVNVVGRLRIAVYWADKPTNVRRCSWFYKGATDARYVPYTEPVAEKLEEEYRHGVTTGEWHRRLVLPNSESVVMHGPGVMVHFPQAATDVFGSTPLFAFGKRVYRNPPKIRVCRDQSALVDHLVLVVHGAGEYRHQKEKAQFVQSTMRPRVVRRGCDETEIEDPEPSNIDHLLLLCHGVGSACDMRFRSVEEVVDDFRSTSLQLLQSHYRNSFDQGIVNRIEVLPISWHATLHSGETGVDKRLAAITLDSIPKLRNFTNDTVLDVLFYTSPVFCQTIIDTVCAELNRIYELFTYRNPQFTGRVSLGGHSLGSVILYDLLCHQPNAEVSPNDTCKSFVSGSAGSGQPAVSYPALVFHPAALYALGSPIAMFECIRGVKSLGMDFSLPTCKNFFNIFHPYDPIAYRIEPLINAQLGNVKPSLIPHHKGRKRMHLELKDTMARVGADLKQKLLESLKSTWTSMWKTTPNEGQLEKVVEEEMEKEQLCEETKEDDALNGDLGVQEAVSAGRLNGGRRVDYVLQEAPIEMINEYLFAMSSHVCYWESEDTMLLILREIYDALGVRPDCSRPQHSLSVQRARPRPEENETIIMSAAEHPSTSRGGT